MASITAVDEKTGRKFLLDEPDDHSPAANQAHPLVFLLNLHGGGSVGAWQRLYFPACDYSNKYRLVIATPSCATKKPFRHWVGDADDEHLHNIVNFVFDKYGAQAIRSFWLVGHSQGGMTSSRLLARDDFFKQRVDGWLSLSGGRLGRAEVPANFFPGAPVATPEQLEAMRRRSTLPDCDLSFIFATGQHEIVALPDTSPWAEKYGAGPRVRMPDVIDEQPGQIHDTLREGKSTIAWGNLPRPGTAEVYVYPNARDGRVIADVVRLDKGHTEGLEPKVTEQLIKLIVSAPGGKAQST